MRWEGAAQQPGTRKPAGVRSSEGGSLRMREGWASVPAVRAEAAAAEMHKIPESTLWTSCR